MSEEIKKPRRKPGQGKDKIVGKVEYHKEFASSILNNKRDVVVWLPIDYNPQKYLNKNQSKFWDISTLKEKTRVDYGYNHVWHCHQCLCHT